jgi:hypothetical protein
VAHTISFAIGLAALVALLTGAAGCSSNGPALERDASIDAQGSAAECVAAGGKCFDGDAVVCTAVGPQGCGSEGSCCLGGIIPVESCPDGGIKASNYDQTCAVDQDCTAIAQSNTCAACELTCTNSAINVVDGPRYMSAAMGLLDVAYVKCPSSCGDGPGGPCCRGGTCQVGSQCFPTVPAVDAAADTDAAAADAAPDSAGGD